MTACHGDPGVTMTTVAGGIRQYFGPVMPAVTATTTPTLTTIYKGLVGATSFEDPSISIVAADDLAKSFLWYKVNNDQGSIDMETPDPCADPHSSLGSCGSAMPLPLTGLTITLLPQADRDLICNWILQGAKNN